jgi:ribokinase
MVKMDTENISAKPHIAVIGSAQIDLIMRVDRVPEAGETLTGGEFSMVPGGKGANQAVALGRLGAEVVFIGRVGQDPFGDTLLLSLRKSGVNISPVVRDPTASTGTTLILVDRQGENTMVPDYGANLQLCSEDIKRAASSIRKADLVLLQFEVPEEVNLHAVSIAEKYHVPVVINPAPTLPSSVDILKRSYMITPNLVEAEALAGLEGYAADSVDSKYGRALGAAVFLNHAGVERLVITLGNSGSLFLSEEGEKTFGIYRTEQIDATGAGDAFTAALVFGIASARSVEDSVLLASATAALSVSRMGAQSSFPSMAEVQNFINSARIGAPPDV